MIFGAVGINIYICSMPNDISDISVYFHRNPKTGVIFYVGIGRGRRPYDFVRRSILWHRYVAKHGEPLVELLFEGCTKEQAYAHERALIRGLGRRNLGTGELLNLTDGGEGAYGRKMSEKARQALRDANLGNKWDEKRRANYIKAKTGKKVKPRTETHSRSLSLLSPTKKRVVRIALDGSEALCYHSMQEAARENKTYATAIKGCCEGKHKIIAGFKWMYHDEYIHS